MPAATAVETPVSRRIAERRRARAERTERSVTIHTASGNPQGTLALDPDLFGVRPNMAVLHQVVTAQMAGARAGSHSTKRRSEVRGGGRKPWRQKGTGRARQGSIRASQWVGGGIAMGPKPRDYSQSTPKKMIRMALASALSDRAASDRVMVVDDWGWTEPRTKDAVAAVAALKLSGKILLVLGGAGSDEVSFRSFANLPDVAIVPAGELSAWDVLRSDWVVFTLASMDALSPGGTDAMAPAEPAGEDE